MLNETYNTAGNGQKSLRCSQEKKKQKQKHFQVRRYKR